MKEKSIPSPIAITVICSVCGMPWSGHGPNPTTDDCIRLLKAEVAKRSSIQIYQPYYPVVIPATHPKPWWQEWSNTPTYCTTTTSTTLNAISAGTDTPS